jgi:site-specific DNA-methyltransferase (adenine-specific)
MRVEKIGLATLYLADCRDVDLTLAQSIISDPPYGMSFQSNHREDRHEKIANDETEELLLWACGLKPTHSSYLFCRWDNLATVPKPKSLITWVKDNWSMGDLKHEHGRQTEVALFYPGPEHDFPKKRPPDVINCPRSGNALHPTEKPVGLMGVFVDWTRGLVADPFMGSGSTGVAAVKAKREFIGVELHEPYFNIACVRIEEAQRQISLFDTFGGQGV